MCFHTPLLLLVLFIDLLDDFDIAELLPDERNDFIEKFCDACARLGGNSEMTQILELLETLFESLPSTLS